MQPQPTVQGSARILKILWGSLVASVLIYGILVFMISQIWVAVPRNIQSLMSNPILMALTVAAMASLVMAFLIFPAIHAKRRDQSVITMRQRFIVQWALIESVAIYGLVGTFLTQDPRVFVAFAIAAIAAFLLAFPTAERSMPSESVH